MADIDYRYLLKQHTSYCESRGWRMFQRTAPSFNLSMDYIKAVERADPLIGFNLGLVQGSFLFTKVVSSLVFKELALLFEISRHLLKKISKKTKKTCTSLL